MTPKDKANEIFNHHYNIIFNQGDDLSQEIIISVLAKKHALLTVNECAKASGVLSRWWYLVRENIELLH